jgi:hypothetical protein
VENCVCTSHGVQVERVTWRAAARIMIGVGDIVQRTGDGHVQVGYSVARRSGGRVTLCAIYTVHMETRSAGFLVEPQNQGHQVFWFEPQNRQLRFGDFGLKIITTVSWFGPQNQVDNGLSIAPQNLRREDGAGYASRSVSLLHLKASRARIS